MMVISTFMMAGCKLPGVFNEEKTEEKIDPGIGAVWIYVPGNKCVEKKKDAYQLRQPESLSKSVEEILSEEKGSICFNVKSYNLEENNKLVLNSETTEKSTKDMVLLSKAALVKTLGQLTDIGEIQITILNQDGALIDENTYTAESFYYY